jgi:hypothetical protein
VHSEAEEEMNRSNLFSLAPTREQHHILEELTVNCVKLWNEINYFHRQQCENYMRLDWNPQGYKKHVPLVGSLIDLGSDLQLQ